MTARTQYPASVIAKAVKLGRRVGPNKAADELKLPLTNVRRWLQAAKQGRAYAQTPNRDALIAELAELLKKHGPDMRWAQYQTATPQPGAHQKHWRKWSDFRAEALRTLPDAFKLAPERVFQSVKERPLPLSALADKLCCSTKSVREAIERAQAAGYNIHLRGDHYHVEHVPGPARHDDPKLNVFLSDERGVLRYGIVSDNHIGSKYARLDVLNDLYDLFQREGITRVYNCGNWIDGEARFNRHDLEPWAHGMDNQVRAFVRDYPQRKGIETYYVAGDDHEGWYDGVDVGKRAEQTARDQGRTDLHYLGYMEAFVAFRHKKLGVHSVGAFVHPGGGSAYAISYSPQKIVESYQGGEKPAVVHLGHYHKMDVFNYRNVWIMQVGCTQDQTPFMRKKRIEAHVGGILAEVRLDTRGAVTDCITWQRRYFDRGYYNHQFDRAGPLRRIPLAA